MTKNCCLDILYLGKSTYGTPTTGTSWVGNYFVVDQNLVNLLVELCQTVDGVMGYINQEETKEKLPIRVP